MEIRVNLISPFILILIGLGFLLSNLGIIPLSPWEALLAYWPALIILWGGKRILDFVYRRVKGYFVSSTEFFFFVFVTLLGVYLLAPKVGWKLGFFSWNIIWPTLLIVIGLYKLFTNSSSLVSVTTTPDGTEGKFSFVGEIHRGGTSWKLEDMYLRHGIGEIHLDLTQAIIPNREVKLDIAGLVGELTIYLPADLPIRAECTTSIGDVQILDTKEGGLGKVVTVESPDYKLSEKRLNLRAQWKVGEVKVRRIG